MNEEDHLKSIRSCLNIDFDRLFPAPDDKSRVRLIELAIGVTSKFQYRNEADRLNAVEETYKRLVEIVVAR